MFPRLQELRDDDRGTTLAEVVVGMALLAVFMSMFTGAMFMMTNAVSKVEAVTASSGQVNKAFLDLDRRIRYGTGVSAVTRSATSGDWHVEVATQTQDGSAVCLQLRVHQRTLQQRTWIPSADGTSYSDVEAWRPLASDVRNANPFSTRSAGASSPYQQLAVSLTVGPGSRDPGVTQSSMTFTALNSDGSSTASVCQQVPVDGTP